MKFKIRAVVISLVQRRIIREFTEEVDLMKKNRYVNSPLKCPYCRTNADLGNPYILEVEFENFWNNSIGNSKEVVKVIDMEPL